MHVVISLSYFEQIACDCSTLLNRKGGYTGTGWHAHPHHEDGMGVTTKLPALGQVRSPICFVGLPSFVSNCLIRLRVRQVRSLVYPAGFRAGNDGGLRVVPGGHLYREARLEPTSEKQGGAPLEGWSQNDDAFREEWLTGKTHPLTGEPLEILELDLPPVNISISIYINVKIINEKYK